MGDPGVAEIIDFGMLDTSKAEIAVNSGSDVSNKQGTAGFSNKDSFVRSFLSYPKILF